MQVKERIFYNRNKIFWELFNLYHSLTYIIHKFSIRLDLHVLFTNSQSESTSPILNPNQPTRIFIIQKFTYLYHSKTLHPTGSTRIFIIHRFSTRPTRIIHKFSIRLDLLVLFTISQSNIDYMYLYHSQILNPTQPISIIYKYLGDLLRNSQS